MPNSKVVITNTDGDDHTQEMMCGKMEDEYFATKMSVGSPINYKQEGYKLDNVMKHLYHNCRIQIEGAKVTRN